MKIIVLIILFLLNNQLITAQWKLINPLPFDNYINSSFFINEDIGWVVCEHGEIYKTTDGGENFQLQISGTSLSLFSVFLQMIKLVLPAALME